MRTFKTREILLPNHKAIQIACALSTGVVPNVDGIMQTRGNVRDATDTEIVYILRTEPIKH